MISTLVILTSGILLYGQRSAPEEQPPSAPIPATPNSLYYTGVLGSILNSSTPNMASAHVLSSLRLSNADYPRGSFDAIPEELSSFAIAPTLTTVFQLWKTDDFLRDITLTLGTQQGLTNKKFDNTRQINAWYESNFYAGVVFAFPRNIATAVTYSLGTSPNIGTWADELDFAFAYAGENNVGLWEPSIELSVPLGGTDGVLTQVIANPSFSFFKNKQFPLTVSIPVRFGAGLFGYHVPEDNFTGYFSAGLISQFSIADVPKDFGNWYLAFGVDFLVRDDQFANARTPADNGGNLVIIGNVGISFLY
jgi:hypothetical protein